MLKATAMLQWVGGLGSAVLFLSCSVQPQIPSVADHQLESMLRSEAAYLLTANRESANPFRYRFFLSDFPRKDILGLSVGEGRIYISYTLAVLALTDPNHRWLLRQTMAHEIGHEIAGHAKQTSPVWFNRGLTAGASARDIGLPWYVRWVNYSAVKELEADRIGLEYWIKLGWDCGIWVRILEDFQRQNYTGDEFHPTDDRLRQAQRVCAAQDGPVATVAPPGNVSLGSFSD